MCYKIYKYYSKYATRCSSFLKAFSKNTQPVLYLFASLKILFQRHIPILIYFLYVTIELDIAKIHFKNCHLFINSKIFHLEHGPSSRQQEVQKKPDIQLISILLCNSAPHNSNYPDCIFEWIIVSHNDIVEYISRIPITMIFIRPTSAVPQIIITTMK